MMLGLDAGFVAAARTARGIAAQTAPLPTNPRNLRLDSDCPQAFIFISL